MSNKITIDIDAAEVQEYAAFIHHKHDAILEQVRDYQEQIQSLILKARQLEYTLERLKGLPPSTPIIVDESLVGKNARSSSKRPINGYDVKWSVWLKIKYVLGKQIKPLLKKEIIEVIEEFDPSIAALNGKRKRAFSVSVSACLSIKSSAGVLTKHESDGESFRYSLSNN